MFSSFTHRAAHQRLARMARFLLTVLNLLIVLPSAPTDLRAQLLTPAEALLTNTLQPDGLAASDVFGASIGRDGDTLVVGAPGFNNYTGRTFVFTRDAGQPSGWRQQAILSGDGAPAQYFGHAVAVSGTTIAVGVDVSERGLPDPGVVFIFERVGATDEWRQRARLTLEEDTWHGSFGYALDLEGDTLVVGAHSQYRCAGATYIYQRTTTAHGWQLSQKLDAPGGTAVALDGTTLAVGDSCALSRTGAVYVYHRDNVTLPWRRVTDLVAPNGRQLDFFGSALALDGDVLVVGTERAGSGGSALSAGAAYVFERRPGTDQWQATTTLTPPHPNEQGSFGHAVALRDTTLLVGAPTYRFNGNGYAGAVFVYTRLASGASWSLEVSYGSPPNGSTAAIGSAVGLDGDILLSGAPGADSYRGAVYAHRRYAGPALADDSAQTDEDIPVTIDVLANDWNDPPGGRVEPSSVTVTQSPQHGTAAVGKDGRITYTPALNASTVDRFVYSAANSVGIRSSAAVTVTIRPMNDPPQFVGVPVPSIVESYAYFYGVQVYDVDTADTVTITATILPPWLSLTTIPEITGATLRLTGTPPASAIGSNPVTLVATDRRGLTATQSFTITVLPNNLASPTSLKAVPRGPDSINLTWLDTTFGETGYRIERREGDTWPTVGATPPNTGLFVDTGLTCGISYDYRVRAFNSYSVSPPSSVVSVTPQQLVTQTFAYTGTAIPIWDYSSSSADIWIDADGTVADLDVRVMVRHIYDGDLTLTLIAPDGTEVRLSTQQGGFQHDYSNTHFDDEATTWIARGQPPFTGRFRPSMALDVFDNHSLHGRWRLRVDNLNGPFRGAIEQFELVVAVPSGCTSQPTPQAHVVQAASTPTFTHIAAGFGNLCALRQDGSLGCWGWNDYTQAEPPPGQYRSVDLAIYTGCAVRITGELACWGLERDSVVATKPSGSTYVSVSVGSRRACAIRDDGTLACWGDLMNLFSVPGGSFTQISAGTVHACGLRPNATITCFGVDNYGQTHAPTGTFTQVSAGNDHSCGVRSDGSVVCWGRNADGQTAAPAGTFTRVAAAGEHTCGLRSDGSVTCWGAGGSYVRPPAGPFVQIDATSQNTCGLHADGRLLCWGASPLLTLAPAALPEARVGEPYQAVFTADRGDAPYTYTVDSGDLPPGLQLAANGTLDGVPVGGDVHNFIVRVTDRNGLNNTYPFTIRVRGTVSPTLPPGPPPTPRPQTISAGSGFTCALQSDGVPRCWGSSDYGKTQPPTERFISISAGADHACGISSDQHVFCWGSDSDYNGSWGYQTRSPKGTFTQVTAGVYHSCAIRTDSSVACWGGPAYGRTKAPAGAFVQVAAGMDHTCAIQVSGALACWGANHMGVTEPPSGRYHHLSVDHNTACAVREDGSLRCWGANDAGQATPPNGRFVEVDLGYKYGCALRTTGELACWGIRGASPDGTFVQLAVGSEHACAMREDGTLACWGRADLGATTPPAVIFTPSTATVPTSVAPSVAMLLVGNADARPLREGDVLTDTNLVLRATFDQKTPYLRSAATVLLGEGPTPGFQTLSCAHVNPGDTRIASSPLLIVREQLELWIQAHHSSLPNGVYRLFICDTVTGAYPLLDGNGDGVSGDAFVRTFRLERNLNDQPTPTPPSTTPIPSPVPHLPTLRLNESSGKPGSSLMLWAENLTPGETYIVHIAGAPLVSVIAPQQGSTSFAIRTSASAVPGRYSVTLIAGTSGTTTSVTATVHYTLTNDAPLRSMDAPVDVEVAVPASLRPDGTQPLYLPLIAGVAQG